MGIDPLGNHVFHVQARVDHASLVEDHQGHLGQLGPRELPEDGQLKLRHGLAALDAAILKNPRSSFDHGFAFRVYSHCFEVPVVEDSSIE